MLDVFAVLADQLPDWRLAFARLHDVMGFTDHDTRTIWVDVTLPARQRRCTVVHEVIHALRGHRDDNPEHECAARTETALELVPIDELTLAVARSAELEDVLDALNVDVGVLRDRLDVLTPAEARQLHMALPPQPAAHEGPRCAIARWLATHSEPGPYPCKCRPESRCCNDRDEGTHALPPGKTLVPVSSLIRWPISSVAN